MHIAVGQKKPFISTVTVQELTITVIAVVTGVKSN